MLVYVIRVTLDNGEVGNILETDLLPYAKWELKRFRNLLPRKWKLQLIEEFRKTDSEQADFLSICECLDSKQRGCDTYEGDCSSCDSMGPKSTDLFNAFKDAWVK